MPGRCSWLLIAGVTLLAPPTLLADVFNPIQVRAMIDDGRTSSAIDQLIKEVAENPANEAARILLAEAFEKAGRLDEAIEAWQDVVTLTANEQNMRTARRAISRIRRIQLDTMDIQDLTRARDEKDPFLIDMPEIDWTGLEVVENSKYLPPILPPPLGFEVPPFVHETKHFTVYSTNERLSRIVGERAEIYLDFMLEKLFPGRSWAVRFPIIIYQNESDYQSHGGPVGSGGVTMGHVTGKTRAIILFQQKPNWARGGPGSGGASGGTEIWKYGLESVLPHELTHAVVNEFFGGQETPQWLHEAIAGRFEQTRDHYGEAARLARKVVAGEFFRMRDLFDQEGYPDRVGLFYEQSAAVVLYLFETGPDAMYVFLSELRDGNGHDAACAAALGIPEENAVEEFERRWVEWMKVRYIKDLKGAPDAAQVTEAGALSHRVFQPWVNELDTVERLVNDWRTVEMDSLERFRGVGSSTRRWSSTGSVLRCDLNSKEPSFLGIRMNERAPTALQCDVRLLSTTSGEVPWFGLAQLDADGYDTRVQVRGPLKPGTTHKVVGIWADDLAIYIDGVCTGRFPAFQVGGNAPDIDYPIALVAGASIEVSNLRVGRITEFSTRPIPQTAQPGQPEQPSQQQPTEGIRRRRRGGP
jgi:hypothetical protein